MFNHSPLSNLLQAYMESANAATDDGVLFDVQEHSFKKRYLFTSIVRFCSSSEITLKRARLPKEGRMRAYRRQRRDKVLHDVGGAPKAFIESGMDPESNVARATVILVSCRFTLSGLLCLRVDRILGRSQWRGADAGSERRTPFWHIALLRAHQRH
jgi:hypothetical protein